MMVSGIVLWSVGASLTGVGAGEIVASASCKPVFLEGGSPRPQSTGGGERVGVAQQAQQAFCSGSIGNAAFGMLLAGQFASVIAIPLFVVGNGRVPLGRGIAAPRPELRVGAGSAALRVSF
jgi:hypothetical protein